MSEPTKRALTIMLTIASFIAGVVLVAYFVDPSCGNALFAAFHASSCFSFK